ncbi:MAG: PAS domain S-box protein [Deltaproteobacteria bacterium]|nr:PAS domain S-box protein [Deltaproteobacteria bacterium]
MKEMRMIHWRDSSTWRFFRLSLLCFVTIVLIYTIIYSFSTYHREKDYLHDALNNITKTHVPTLIASLWITDHATVQSTVDGIARFRYIARVEVRDDAGRTFFAGPAADPSMETIYRGLNYTHRGKSVPIGSMSLFIGKRQIVLGMLRSALLILALQLGLSVFLSCVIAWAFHMAFGRYLYRFAQFVKSDDPTQFQRPFALNRSMQQQDELQLLVDHFNDMRKGISGSMDELKAANDGLIAINARLSESERELRKSEAQFAGAFEHAPIGMALVSPEGRWLRANKALSAMLGYSPSELLNMTFQDITHPDDLEPNPAYVQRMLAGEIATHRLEKRYLHKSGRLVWALLSFSLVRDHKEAPLHFVFQLLDVTERKKKEEEMKELISRLQKALDEIKTLKGIVPICSNCKKIRDDKGYWEQVEAYVSRHTEAQFSHGICPACMKKLYPEISHNEKTASVND